MLQRVLVGSNAIVRGMAWLGMTVWVNLKYGFNENCALVMFGSEALGKQGQTTTRENVTL